MIPFGHETVTLVKRIETVVDDRTRVSYEKHTLTSCSWRMRTVRNQYDMETVRSVEITCRIPYGQKAPNVGDVLFLGKVSDVITDSKTLADAIDAHRGTGACRITAVSDNTRAGLPLPHYAATGS